MIQNILFTSILIFSLQSVAVESGFLIGIGKSELDNNNYTNITHETGFRVGVPLLFSVNDFIDVRSGFFYVLRQYQFTQTETDPMSGETITDKIEVRLGYLEFPLLAQLNLSHWFKLFAGPVYAVNVTDKIHANDDNDGGIEGERTSQFLGHVGVGVKFDAFEVDVIYEKGFTKVFQDMDGKWGYVGINFTYWFNTSDYFGFDDYPKYRYR